MWGRGANKNEVCVCLLPQKLRQAADTVVGARARRTAVQLCRPRNGELVAEKQTNAAGKPFSRTMQLAVAIALGWIVVALAISYLWDFASYTQSLEVLK